MDLTVEETAMSDAADVPGRMRRVVRRAAWTWLAAVLVGTGSYAGAQTGDEDEGSKYARPNLASEGQTEVRANGVMVKFFESESDHSSGRKYILYEPPIFLLTKENENGERVFDTSVSRDGTVTLNFQWDTDPEETHVAIREYIDRTWTDAQKAQLKDAIIKPLFIVTGWLETAHGSQVRSQEFRRQSFSTTGTVKAYFDLGTREAAEEFVAAMNETDDALVPAQLIFRYTFAGDALDSCEATATSEQVAHLQREKSIAGEGGVGVVSRDQFLEVAENAFRQMNLQSTCRDVGVAAELAREAFDMLGNPEKIAAWEQLDAFSGLSPKDFVADLTSNYDDEHKTVARDQVRDAVTKARSDQKNGKVAAGWGGFMGAVSAGLASASQDARAEMRDQLDKRSLSAQWVGEQLVPKSLEVHSREAIERRLTGSVTARYTMLSDETEMHEVTLTEANKVGAVFVTPETGRDLRRDIDRLDAALDRLEQAVAAGAESTSNEIEGRVRYVTGRLGTRIDRLTRTFERGLRAQDEAIERLMGSMITTSYEFRLKGRDKNGKTRSDFATGISSIVYPVGFVNSWWVEPGCVASGGPLNPQLVVNVDSRDPEREWLIAVKDADSKCGSLGVVVTFARSSLFESTSHTEREGRTGGGSLEAIR